MTDFAPHIASLRVLYLQMAPMKLVAALLLDPGHPVAVAEVERNDGDDCKKAGLSRYQRWILSYAGQQTLCRDLFLHRDSVSYPVQISYSASVMKKLHTFFEESFRALEAEKVEEGDRVDEGEDEDDLCICDELLEFYMECIHKTGGRMAAHRIEDARATTAEMFYKSFYIPTWTGVAPTSVNSRSILVPVKVTQDFVNVGLAVWPAGLVIVELLRLGLFRMRFNLQRDKGSLPEKAADIRCSRNILFEGLEETSLRIVELGAGVGFTAGAFLEWLSPDVKATMPPVAYCLMTDYQDLIVDNCLQNIDLVRKEVQIAVGTAQPVDRKDLPEGPTLEAPMLDWCEHEANEKLLAELRPNVIIAADVVYDRCVVPALATTLEQSLRHGGPLARAIVVSTKRNEDTFGLFLEELNKRDFEIHSYPLPEVRASYVGGGGGAEEDPLTAWATCDHFGLQALLSQQSGEGDILGSDLSPLGSFPFFVAMQNLVVVHVIRLSPPVL